MQVNLVLAVSNSESTGHPWMLRHELWLRGRVHLVDGELPHSSMKTMPKCRKVYRSLEQARVDLFDYIEAFYNRTGRHCLLVALASMRLNATRPEDGTVY